MPLLSRVRLVLLRPRNPENLGAVARVMKNMGLANWALVDPRSLDFHSARRVAVHSEEILDRPLLVERLDDAVADAAWVVGTTSRSLRGSIALGPESFASEATARIAAGNQVALVFGDERSGMTNRELERCHAVARIPTEPAQPSLNLAQAVAIFAHALRASAIPAAPLPPRPEPSNRDLTDLEDALGEALVQCGFLDARRPRHALRDLMSTLKRTRLSPSELRLWRTALHSMRKGCERSGSSVKVGSRR